MVILANPTCQAGSSTVQSGWLENDEWSGPMPVLRIRFLCVHPKDTNTILPTKLTALKNTDAAENNAAQHACKDIDAMASILVQDERLKHQVRQFSACRGQAQSTMTFGTKCCCPTTWTSAGRSPDLDHSDRSVPHRAETYRIERIECREGSLSRAAARQHVHGEPDDLLVHGTSPRLLSCINA